MKIELKLTNDELVCINNKLQACYQRGITQASMVNVINSIGYDLADSFNSKVKTRIKKANLFDSRKKNKMTLKYHEAWALKAIIYEAAQSETNDYQKNLLQKQFENLDQKLA